MKKYLYDYNNNGWKLHTKFVSDKTIKREGADSSRVYIYEVDTDDYEFDRFIYDNSFIPGKYVTGLLLK